MALDDHARGATLRCGTLLDDLIVQVTEGRAALDAAHEATCEYCQEALEMIRAAWEEFLELARATVDVPADLTQRITRQIQSLAQPSHDGVSVAAIGGQTLLHHEVLRRIARTEVLRFDEVALATVTVNPEVQRQRETAWLRLRLVVCYGPRISELADAIRVRIRAALAVQAGVTSARIDVEVADIVLADDEIS